MFDLGANLGSYTLLAAKCVASTGQVHSFEPSSRMFEELRFNVSLNGFSDLCILNNAAVSDSRGTASLSKYGPGGEVYGLLGRQHWAENVQIIGHEEVQTITLDQYVNEHGIGRVDLIKMDIEGAELLALRGGHRLLNRLDGPAIVLEVADLNTQGFGYRALDILHELKASGYSVHYLQDDSTIGLPVDRRTETFQGENFVALKSRVDERAVGKSAMDRCPHRSEV